MCGHVPHKSTRAGSSSWRGRASAKHYIQAGSLNQVWSVKLKDGEKAGPDPIHIKTKNPQADIQKSPKVETF